MPFSSNYALSLTFPWFINYVATGIKKEINIHVHQETSEDIYCYTC